MLIERMEVSCLQGDEKLVGRLLEILTPLFTDPSIPLSRALNVCSTVYLGRGDDNQIQCFFFVNHRATLQSGNVQMPCVHLGLSAAGDAKIGTGAILDLYLRGISDAVADDAQLKVERAVWGTTINPFVFRTVSRFCPDTEPRLDGTYSSYGECIAKAVRQSMGLRTISEMDHPFILRAPLPGYRWTERESIKIKGMIARRNNCLFNSCSVDDYDQIIFAFPMPSKPPQLTRSRLHHSMETNS